MKKLKILLIWEFQIIENFFLKTPEFFVSEKAHNNSFSADGGLSDSEVSIGTLNLTYELTIIKLNNTVDFALLLIINHILPEVDNLKERNKRMRFSRSDMLTLVSQHGVNYRTIPGWEVVEIVKEDSNALKHRGGMQLYKDTEFNIPVSENVMFEKQSIELKIQEVKKWIFDLIDKANPLFQDI